MRLDMMKIQACVVIHQLNKYSVLVLLTVGYISNSRMNDQVKYIMTSKSRIVTNIRSKSIFEHLPLYG